MMRGEHPKAADPETTGKDCDGSDDGTHLVAIDDLPAVPAICLGELTVIETFMADILDAVFDAPGRGLLAPSASAMSISDEESSR